MNLLSKLHRNSILTGPVESYCLVCGYLLHSEEESYAHIHEPTHVAKLSAVPQLADFNDCVIKCKSGYFCRYCNVILPTIKRVSLHVAESTHHDNRISQSIIRQAGVILAFDAVIINDRAWNGLDGSTCSVCNEDYDDEESHRRDTSHVLNLIQTVCEFGDTYIYRKVDDELFFCLICNEIIPILEKSTHSASEKHSKLFEKSKLENNDIQTPVIIETNNNNLKLPVNEAKSDEIHKTAQDIKPKPIQNKAHNGSAHDINHDRHTTQDNIQKSGTLHVNVNNEDQTKNTAPNNKRNETGQQKKDTSKEPKPTNNDTTKVPPKKESYLYETLKANNFIIKTEDGLACCALCDVKIHEAYIVAHTQDSHHNILYAKALAKKNRKPVNESKTVISETKELTTKKPKTAVADKDNTVNLAVVKAADKSVKVRGEDAPKDTKELNINTAKQTTPEITNEKQDKPKEIKTPDIIKHLSEENKESQECISKENTPPSEKNGIQMGIISNEQGKESNAPEYNASKATSKKGNKKAQKKAAKSRAETGATPKSITNADSLISQNIDHMGNEIFTAQKGVGDNSSNASDDKPERNNLDKDNKIILNGNNHYEEIKTQRKEIDAQTKETMANIALDVPELKTERLLNLLKTASQVDNQDDVVINGKYVLGNQSFVLVVESDDQTKCVACDEELVGGITKHIITDEHKNNVEECLVVTSLDDEFVRQVKSKEYHCGYCNIVLPNWEEMKSHLDSYQHSEAKISAEWRLQRYQPHLKNCEMREVRSVLETIFRCTKE